MPLFAAPWSSPWWSSSAATVTGRPRARNCDSTTSWRPPSAQRPRHWPDRNLRPWATWRHSAWVCQPASKIGIKCPCTVRAASHDLGCLPISGQVKLGTCAIQATQFHLFADSVGSVMGSVNGGFIPDDARSHVSGYSLNKAGVNLARSRSLADGQSQRSMSAMSGRYLPPHGLHGMPMSMGLGMGLGVPNMGMAMSRPGGQFRYSERQRSTCSSATSSAATPTPSTVATSSTSTSTCNVSDSTKNAGSTLLEHTSSTTA